MGKNWRRGQSKNGAVTENNAIVADLWANYEKLGTWGRVAAEYGVTSGMAYRVAHGYVPRRLSIRRALHFPETVAVPVCPVHGVVHTRKTCPPATDGPRKPRARSLRRLTLVVAGLMASGRMVVRP